MYTRDRRRFAMRVLSFALVFLAAMILTLPLSAQEKTAEETVGKVGRKATEPAIKTEVEAVEIEPFTYCAVEMAGSYTQHSDAFMKLYSEAAKQGLPMAGVPFGIYYNSPEETPEEELKWEIGMPVPADKELQAPLVMKKWEYTLVAQRDFEGAYDSEELKAAYTEVYGWIYKNGYEPAGPMMEKFLTSPAQNEEGEFVGKVQIVFPVKKKE
jgi:effector-binding domain-containing protein